MTKIISLIVLLSLLTISCGKTCTKEYIHTYTIYKMNTFTQRLNSSVQIRKNIIFVCCEGYIETSRNRIGPICKPICNHPCGHGTCYSPNLCACDDGYKRSETGTCVPDEGFILANTTHYPTPTSTKSTTTTNHPEPTTIRTTTTTEKLHFRRFGSRTSKQNEEITPTKTNFKEITSSQVLTTPKSVATSTTHEKLHFRRFGSRTSKQLVEITTPKTNFKEITSSQALTTAKSVPISVDVELQRIIEKHYYPPLEQDNTRTTYIIPDHLHTISPRNKPISTLTPSINQCGTNVECNQGMCVSGRCICPPGYKLTYNGNCQPACSQSCLNGRCILPNHCECIDGYTYDSESLQCKPLCNGKIYGCIRGTCVGYNQCRCDHGTILQRDELFHCVDQESLKKDTLFNWRWYLLLLLLPAGLIVMSFCIIIGRWKRVKENRLEAQDENFPEMRYYDPSNDHSVNEKHLAACESEERYDRNEPSCSRGTIRRNGNVVIINTGK